MVRLMGRCVLWAGASYGLGNMVNKNWRLHHWRLQV